VEDEEDDDDDEELEEDDDSAAPSWSSRMPTERAARPMFTPLPTSFAR
jgi:hypothetical protein